MKISRAGRTHVAPRRVSTRISRLSTHSHAVVAHGARLHDVTMCPNETSFKFSGNPRRVSTHIPRPSMHPHAAVAHGARLHEVTRCPNETRGTRMSVRLSSPTATTPRMHNPNPPGFANSIPTDNLPLLPSPPCSRAPNLHVVSSRLDGPMCRSAQMLDERGRAQKLAGERFNISAIAKKTTWVYYQL